MTSVPKKYRDRVDVEDAKPVESSPAIIPNENNSPVAEAKPAEPSPAVEKNPVEQAALKKRLEEMERAQKMGAAQAQPQPQPRAEPIAIDEPQRQQPQQPQSVEQIIATSGLPALVQNWLRQHPDLITDPAKNAQLQKAHHIAEYLTGGDVETPYYLQRLEETLGYRPKSNGNGAAQQPAVQPTSDHSRGQAYRPTQAAPVRQQQYAAPVSAPPTRENYSMSTGKPRNARVPLTEDERQIARNSGISDAEYERQKDRMNAMKVAGYIQDGRLQAIRYRESDASPTWPRSQILGAGERHDSGTIRQALIESIASERKWLSAT
jgi:hypothetical protein